MLVSFYIILSCYYCLEHDLEENKLKLSCQTIKREEKEGAKKNKLGGNLNIIVYKFLYAYFSKAIDGFNNKKKK